MSLCRQCLRAPKVGGQRGYCSTRCRFWSKVEIGDGCWLWLGSANNATLRGDTDYGRFIEGGQRWMAHRYSYTILVGEIPNGYEVDHLCGNTRCVRPDHLDAVTPEEHDRRSQHGGYNRAKTHCPAGHEYSPANTRERRDGARACRTCERARRRRRTQELEAR